MSVRDVLTWIRFINLMACDLDDDGSIDVATAYVHGACLTLLDGIGTATTAMDKLEVTYFIGISNVECDLLFSIVISN